MLYKHIQTGYSTEKAKNMWTKIVINDELHTVLVTPEQYAFIRKMDVERRRKTYSFPNYDFLRFDDEFVCNPPDRLRFLLNDYYCPETHRIIYQGRRDPSLLSSILTGMLGRLHNNMHRRAILGYVGSVPAGEIMGAVLEDSEVDTSQLVADNTPLPLPPDFQQIQTVMWERLAREAMALETDGQTGVISHGHRGDVDFSKTETKRTVNADEDLDALFAEIDKAVENR